MPARARVFDESFILGASSAASPISATAGEPVIHELPGDVRRPGAGPRAADDEGRIRDECAAMADIGLDVYDLSMSWAQLQPDGRAVNVRALDAYERRIDALLACGIQPWITLQDHADVPAELAERGGWRDRDTAYRFCYYAASVHERLSDRVRVWTTFSEPWCTAFLRRAGHSAPAGRDHRASLTAMHHLLLGHGLTVEALRHLDLRAKLGVTLNLIDPVPANPDHPGDVEATRRIDGQVNRVFLDALFRGWYPDDVRRDVSGLGFHEVVRSADLATIAQPLDLLGVSFHPCDPIYDRPALAVVPRSGPLRSKSVHPFPAADRAWFRLGTTPASAQVLPSQTGALHRLLTRLHREYTGVSGTPLVVFGNGAASDDVRAVDGVVRDSPRDEFLAGQFGEVLDAVADGVAVQGYLYSPLFDDSARGWTAGERRGLVHADAATSQLTVKDSGLRFGRTIGSRRLGSRNPEMHSAPV